MPIKAHGLLMGILLLIVQTVVDAALSISSPAAGSQIQQGARTLVTWSGLESNSSTISITLGETAAFTLKAILGSVPSAAAGSILITIPPTVTPDTDYYVRLATLDIPAISAIQGPFSITPSVISSVRVSASSAAPSSSIAISSAAPGPSAVSSLSSASFLSASSSSVPSSGTSTPTDTSDANKSGNENSSSLVLSTGVIAGIAVGGVAAIGLAIAGCLCIRRQNKEDDQLADHTAAAIFASQANNPNKKESAAKSPPKAYANYPTSPRQLQSQQTGHYYSTGYDDPYYNYNTNDPMYDQQQQQQYYAGYGYHPAAALTPQNPMAVYGGYSSESTWANNQQYYSAPTEQQPYSPTNAYYPGGDNRQYQPPQSAQHTHNSNNV